jgi:FAD dependent oxidoreductase
MKIVYAILLLLLFPLAEARAQRVLRTGVLVVGGGTGGTAAGIQAARMGVSTIIVEPTLWLGGMITAAGVSAFDGNHNMPSGIWAQFREQVYKVYGGPKAVETGWVSNTLFEPHVGDSIFKSMAAAEKKLTVLFQWRFVKVLKKGNTVTGAVFENDKKEKLQVLAAVTIDATDLGDVMANAGIPFDLGMEAGSSTGENVQVPESNDIIQDLTYVAILKDYGKDTDNTIARPANYDPMEFDGCCNEFCSVPAKLTSNVTAQKMLDYGKLPNGKYMINWPGKGNDMYLNSIALTYPQRQEAFEKAKAKTMRFVYFLQTQFGFKNLALANDEFPTADKLPFVPYHREARRLKGIVRFKIQHIAKPFTSSNLYRTGVAVGDYPIDHHHRENTNAPQHLGFYPVPSYNLPIGCLLPPQQYKGIIVAEKSTSVSNVVNGTTRLQPIVLLTGQAAGILAALSVKTKQQPAQAGVRAVQATLLKAGAYIMPYFDVKPTHPHFAAIQKIGAAGILRGTGEPYKWANRTWFYPDSAITTAAFISGYTDFDVTAYATGNEWCSIGDVMNIAFATAKKYSNKIQLRQSAMASAEAFAAFVKNNWVLWGLKNFDAGRKITRSEIAVLLNETINPFELKQVDYTGNFID